MPGAPPEVLDRFKELIAGRQLEVVMSSSSLIAFPLIEYDQGPTHRVIIDQAPSSVTQDGTASHPSSALHNSPTVFRRRRRQDSNRPFRRGPNPYGRKGCRKCVNCRRHRRKVFHLYIRKLTHSVNSMKVTSIYPASGARKKCICALRSKNSHRQRVGN